MADKGTCISNVVDEIRQYSGPGLELIRNFQFMRGTTTARDKKLARLYNEFNQARRARTGPITYAMPVWRSIPIEKTIHVESVIYSYDQVSHFIENYEPLSVSSCYCRQAAKLLDPGDTCDAPQEACMTLGEGATGLIERGISREITKEEAYDILDASEKAGLIHTSNNIQDIFCICNCCSCHCMWIEYALNQAKPREAWSVSTRPRIDFKLCEDCRSDRICIERCPTDALSLSADNSMRLDMDRCLGCGLCAIDCMDNAVVMRARPDAPTPPLDFAAFEVEMREAWMKRLAEQGSP